MDIDTRTRASGYASDKDHQSHVEAGGEKRTGQLAENGEKIATELEKEGFEAERQDVHDPSQYPGPAQLAAILLAAALSFFLVALDITIVSTAIPAITAEFHSLNDVAWYNGLSSVKPSSKMLI